MLSSLSLESNLSNLPGIGTFFQSKLASLGIFTIKDLLYYFPFRYEDLSNKTQIINLTAGSKITLTATLWQITKIRTRTGKSLLKATINDQTGSLEVVWFNQDYLLTVLKPNQVYNFSGKVAFFGRKLNLVNPKVEKFLIGQEQVHTGRLIPIYSETSGIRSNWIRAKIHKLLNTNLIKIPEILPQNLLTQESLIDRNQALKEIHFPSSIQNLEQARERLAFEELLLLNLRNLSLTKKTASKKFPNWKFLANYLSDFELLLPFKLTSSQIQAIEEIAQDLKSNQPMNRLLQGEVGSGKTIVSAFAIWQAKKAGFQAAFMAPTAILAKQHHDTLEKIFSGKLKIELITAKHKPKNLDFDLAIGTQALFSEKNNFRNLGLIVVDEQQRFGVNQRQLLRSKGRDVHFLSMTATPIPRTLMLTLAGQLNLSTLEELPNGRKEIKTYFVPQVKRESAYGFIRKKLKEGGQMFLVCPLINTSESLESVKSAVAEYERVKTTIFPDLKVGLLHGKMKSLEKDEIISEFRQRKLDILVTTPVVEVGIDIPTANVILIEAADRFGLSSLHQLRGRVGRRGQKSFCLLFTESNSERVSQRLKLLEKSDSGLELAELDLKYRGPGDLFGSLQHGQIELKSADFVNLGLINRSKTTAAKIFETGMSKALEDEVKKSVSVDKIFSRD